MKVLFDRPSKHTLTVGEDTYNGGEVFEVDDETGQRLLAIAATHCRLPGAAAEAEAQRPRGRRRIPQGDEPAAPASDQSADAEAAVEPKPGKRARQPPGGETAAAAAIG